LNFNNSTGWLAAAIGKYTTPAIGKCTTPRRVKT
jgi:hypothetical protein